MQPSDPARAIIKARVSERGLKLTAVSRLIGANPAYLQQYLQRGIPRVLPEDKREALAQVLELDPEDLRPPMPGKGGPRTPAPDGIAANQEEISLLRLFRELPQDRKKFALGIMKVLLHST